METHNPILIDSNVLIHAVNASSKKQKKAQEYILSNKHSLAVAHQNILESLRVLTHPKFSDSVTTKQALRLIQAITMAIREVHPDESTQAICVEFLKKHGISGNDVFDAYLVATMLSNGIETIATENEKDFRIYPQIRVINPFK